MKRLKELFDKAGFENVSTHINNGNIIFETKESNSEILLQNI
ncbi:MAG: DUF1697 domain-containing protein [bacterium]|nr:DUF1697 domain-containing protein [bacterium]